MDEQKWKKTKRILSFILAQIVVITMYASYSETSEKIRKDVSVVIEDGNYYLESPHTKIAFVQNESVRKIDNDVVVQDLRKTDDPDIKIIDSYQITDRRKMFDIITMIQMYDQINPDDEWFRDKYTMYFEWIAHNVCYEHEKYVESCVDVDFRENEFDSICDTLGLKKVLK